MYNSRYISKLVLPITFLILSVSCSKQDKWLDQKQNLGDVTPKSLTDLQAVLDDQYVFYTEYPIAGLEGADNNYINDADLAADYPPSRNAYLWAQDIYQGESASDWDYPYTIVEYTNIVLDALGNITAAANTQAQINNVHGSALFYRSLAFYNLAQLYCKPYSAQSAGDLGIPLRLTSDVNVKSVRSTIQQTYDQITTDLQLALTLLPKTPVVRTRPGAAAANALLAKTYFVMESYDLAGQYADAALGLDSTLLDYNSLNVLTDAPFPGLTQGNPEIVFYSESYGTSDLWPTANGVGNVDPALYLAYDDGDLRKTALYAQKGSTGFYKFRSAYSELNTYNFTGIGTNELYLLRAECRIRTGNRVGALADLNTLLQKRYTPATFQPWTSANDDDIIRKIVLERRKELPYTGNLRWEDLRRLNKDPRFAVTLTRTYQGQTYTLPPNDERYVLPIADDEIRLSGIQQNPR